MNIFEAFHTNEYNSATLLLHNNKNMSLKEFKKFVIAGIEFLKTQKPQNIVILSENSFDFCVWFFASIFSKKQIYLLTDASKLNYFDFEYILVQKAPEKIEKDIKFINPDIKNTLINFFTSGSTTKPKLITKTLQNTTEEAKAMYESFISHIKKPLRVLTSTHSQHMFAFSYYFILPMCYFDKLLLDTTEICYPDDANFKDSIFISTPSFLEKFEKYNVQNSYSPNIIFSAGAQLKKEAFNYLEKNSQVINIYGSTETGTIAYQYNSNQEALTLFKNVKISSDEDSRLVAKSPYFLQDSITLGDIIEISDSQHFVLKGRADRIFKIQEKRVSAPETEEIIKKLDCNMIKDCYCFKSGEKLACAAVLSETGQKFFYDNQKSFSKLTTFLKKELTKKLEIIPQKWKFLYEIPKTKTGKIDLPKIKKCFQTNISLPFVSDCQKTKTKAVYSITFPSGCNFFEGHFTGFPVLPGVVQLYFANFFAKDAFGDGIDENCVKKIKFSKIIKPNEDIELVIERKDNSINYMYKRDKHICSSGVMTINEKD